MPNDRLRRAEVTPTSESSGSGLGLGRALQGMAVVLVAQVVTLASSWAAIHLAGRFWGELGTAHFLQWRRVSGSISPLVALGLATALAKAVGGAFGREEERREIVTSALAGIVAALLGFGLIGCAFPEFVGTWLLGGPELAYLGRPLVLGTVGQALGLAAVAVLRGSLRYRAANAIAVGIAGAAPTVSILVLAQESLERALWSTAVVQLLIGAALPLMHIARAARERRIPCLRVIGVRLGALLAFGGARLPLLALSALMFNFASWQLAGTGEWDDLSAFNTSLVVCRSASLLTGALGFALLPVLAARMSGSESDGLELRTEIRRLLEAAVALSVLGSILLVVHGPEIVQLLAGHGVEFPPLGRVVFLMVGGLLVADVTRVPLDAKSTFPYAIVASGSGAGALVASYFVLRGMGVSIVGCASLSLAVGFSVYGVVAVATVVRVFDLAQLGGGSASRSPWRAVSRRLVPLGVALGALATRVVFGPSPAAALVSCGVWFALSTFAWWIGGAEWLHALVGAVRSRRRHGVEPMTSDSEPSPSTVGVGRPRP